MKEITSSLSRTLIEIVSDACGVPVPLIGADSQLEADLGLTIDQIEDLRFAVEFDLGIAICPDSWLQVCDAISSMEEFLEESRCEDHTLAAAA